MNLINNNKPFIINMLNLIKDNQNIQNLNKMMIF